MKPTKQLFAITMVAVFAVTVAFASLPMANSQLLQYRPQFIFVSAAPDPVGVGQTVYIVYWTSEMPMPCDNDPKLGAPGGRECWTGVTLTITKPDGNKMTIDMPPSDPVGGGYYILTPDQAGKWSIQAHIPGQWKNRTKAITTYGASQWQVYPAGSYYFKPADSPIAYFTVQAEPLKTWPEAELPTSYWTRPINAGLREWSQIAGNWLADGRGNPYTDGPETGHIVWTKELFFGGITGEPYSTISVYEGTSYEAKWSGVVIMFGRLYYNQPLSDSVTSSHRKVVCRDLRTGDLIWERNRTSINRGTIYEYWSPNQHGTHPYLWTYDNTAIDPFTGYDLFKINNIPSGVTVSSIGPNGEWLIYVFGGALTPSTLFYRSTLNVSWVACWNFSAIPSMLLGSTGTSAWQWRPVGKTHDGKQGYVWNITLPAGLRATTFNIAVLEDRIIAGEGWQQFGTAQPTGKFRLWAVSLKKEVRGTKLWDIWINPPVPNATLQFNGASMCSLKDGVVVVRSKETRQWIGFDINNGKQLWMSEPENQWMMYSSGCTISDGMLYAYGYGGTLYAYDVKNGKLLWTATTDPCGLEGPYDRWPIGSIYLIDGKIYATTSEHSATHPLYRGWKLYVFDAKNGAPIWNMTGFWQGLAFADGYMVGLDGMDLLLYCFGKGPTATTVTASPKTCTNGTSVIIEGTVMDISPGTKSTALTARFPNGVPAVADECMTPWMEHLYKQYALPIDVKGVSVTLDAVGPDGKWISIGETTSDSTGHFSIMWTPPSEGIWTIVATFPGSKSYWPSYAETKVGVMAAPVPSATAEQAETLQNAIDYMQTVQTILIVLVAIAIIIGVYSIYDHRKLRK